MCSKCSLGFDALPTAVLTDRQTLSSALCYGAPQPILVAPGLSPPFSFAMSSHINRIAQSAVLGPDSPPYCFVADQGIPFYLGASPAEGHQGSIQFRAIMSSAAVVLACRVPRVGAFILLGSVPMMGLLDCLDRHVSFYRELFSAAAHRSLCPTSKAGEHLYLPGALPAWFCSILFWWCSHFSNGKQGWVSFCVDFPSMYFLWQHFSSHIFFTHFWNGLLYSPNALF